MHRRDFLLAGAGALMAARFARSQPGPARLKVVAIGHTGRGEFGHDLVRPWSRLPDTELVAISDPDPAGLARQQAKMKVARGFSDYRKMLSEVRPDVVLVCPRHIDQHHAMALAAIESGARGLYLEKPMCRNLGEADEIVAACAQRGVTCAVAHRNRYHPTLAVVERLIREGAIGRVLEVRGRGKEDARGGAADLWVLGSHILNLGVMFTGRPTACSGVLLQDGRLATREHVTPGGDAVGPIAGNALHVRFETQRGIPLFFDSVKGGAPRGAGFGLQIVGNEGIIDLRLDEHPIAHLCAGNPTRPTSKPREWTPITSAGLGQLEPLADIVELVRDHVLAARDLVQAIREQRDPLVSARDGRAVIEMIMATFESHRRGGARVEFPFRAATNPLEHL